MKISAIVRALVAAHATPEMILAAVEAAEGEQDMAIERRRASDRERQARHRSADRNVMSRDVTVTDRDNRDETPAPSPEKRKVSPCTPSKEKTNPSHTPHITTAQASDAPMVRAELAAVLDAEHVDAVIKHRRAIKKPLTVHAAQLLARKFALTPDPNAAADQMVCNGWQGFEPGWVANREQGGQRGAARSPPARSAFQQHQDAADAALNRILGIDDDERDRDHHGPEIDLAAADYRPAGPAKAAR